MEHPFCIPKGNSLGCAEGVHAAARLERTLPYAIMRDSLPVQLHDTMISSKQSVSSHRDSLLSITNHMLSHRSIYCRKINGFYMQVFGNISIFIEVR